MSAGQLLEKGYRMNLCDGHLALFDKECMLIIKVPASKNRMFRFDIINSVYSCLNTIIHDDSWLWHLRFGHLNFRSLKLMAQENMIRNLPKIDHPNQLCEACTIGKNHRHSFVAGRNMTTKQPLEHCPLRCMWSDEQCITW